MGLLGACIATSGCGSSDAASASSSAPATGTAGDAGSSSASVDTASASSSSGLRVAGLSLAKPAGLSASSGSGTSGTGSSTNSGTTTTNTTGTTSAPAQSPATSTSSPAVTTVAGARDLRKWPFSQSSPWNWPIGSGASYASSSDPRVVAARRTDIGINANSGSWSIPVYYASASDPVQTVWVSPPSGSFRAGTVSIRMPANAQAALPAWNSGWTDAHLVILDPDGRYSHEFWQMRQTGANTWQAASYAKVDLAGSGVGYSGHGSTDPNLWPWPSYYNEHPDNLGWGATRAYGGSSLGGLIRQGEIDAGVIRHVLAVALNRSQLKDPAVWPASKSDGQYPAGGAVPMGSLLAIPKSVNIDALGLSPPIKTIARALQDYGAYVVDMADTFCFYVEPAASGEASQINQNAGQLNTLRQLLTVVANNGHGAAMGGGGTPLVPLAPAVN